MRFYTGQHRFCAGIDLHARPMHVCVLDDANKIARLLKGGNFPLAYVHPKGMRETRDLLRRRMYLVHKRVELIAHLPAS